MFEFAFAIIALVAMIATRKLWRAWLEDQADGVNVFLAEKQVDRQDDIATLQKKVDEAIKQNGEWLTLDKIQTKMK